MKKAVIKISSWPKGVPRFWEECGVRALCLLGREGRHLRRERGHTLTAQLVLVLQSKSIPYKLVKGQRVDPVSGLVPDLIFVPAIVAEFARQELAGYLAEVAAQKKEALPRVEPQLYYVVIACGLLALFFALCSGWWGGLGLSFAQWVEKGELSPEKVFYHGQVFRIFTALTLHADASHLAGNIIFGGVILWVLALRLGALPAIFLTIFAGGLGNITSAWWHLGAGYESIGASTALFGTAGIACGLEAMAGVPAPKNIRVSGLWLKNFWPKKFGRQLLLPLGVAFAWLGFLGSEGENVDKISHLAGLLAGFVIGVICSFHPVRSWLVRGRGFCGVALLAIVLLSWLCGLSF